MDAGRGPLTLSLGNEHFACSGEMLNSSLKIHYYLQVLPILPGTCPLNSQEIPAYIYREIVRQ